jgi:hypothetical protein
MSDPDVLDPHALPAPERHSRAVPFLLAVAAIVAALVTARAALLASDASVLWIRSVGEEQKRGAMLQEEVRYAYGTEGTVGFMLLTYQARAEELRANADGQPATTAGRLLTEAQGQQSVVDLVGSDSPLFTDPRYRLPSGGLDLELRLADARAGDPDSLALDPIATLEAGDAAAERSDRLLLTTILIAAAFLFGSLAQAFRGRRRPLLVMGWIVLVAGGAAALAIELGAGTGAS